jgi:hypothetical protein
MAKKLIVYFIALSALELFNFTFLGADLIKVFQLTGIALIFLVLIIHLLYHQTINFQKYFNMPIMLILIGVLLSMYMAQWGHDQSMTTTFIAQRFMYFYLVYWTLHSLKISTDDLESVVFWLGITFSVFYIIQFFVYPTIIFDVRIAEDRGTIRIFLAGFSFLILSYFLTLNRLFESFSIGKLLSIFLFISILILMGTRQVIFSVMLITFMFILFSKVVKSKILIIMLMTASIIPIIIVFQEIFISLIDLSKSQSESLIENVRIRAAGFFLTEFFPNNIAYITGNGADSANSNYGYLIQMYKDAYGFYQSDIGLIGDYTKFGAAFVIGVFIILYKAIFNRTQATFGYIKFFFLSILLTLFTGGGPFAGADSITAICFTLYILDIDKHDRKVIEEEEELEAENEETESLEERYII